MFGAVRRCCMRALVTWTSVLGVFELSDSRCCVFSNYLRNWHPTGIWQLHLLKSSYVTVTRELAAVSCRITWGSRIGCVHTTRMGCAGSKEPKEPELNSNRDEATSLDGINVAEKPGVSLQRKKSSQVGRTSPDAERCHARRLTSVAPLWPCGPARAARPSRALPAPSLLIASLPAPSGTKRCRVGRPVSGAWV